MHATCRLGFLVCHEPIGALYTYIYVYNIHMFITKLQVGLRLMTPGFDLSGQL